MFRVFRNFKLRFAIQTHFTNVTGENKTEPEIKYTKVLSGNLKEVIIPGCVRTSNIWAWTGAVDWGWLSKTKIVIAIGMSKATAARCIQPHQEI